MEHNEDYQLDDIISVFAIWVSIIVIIFNDIKDTF
jgi:hypothetical protein